MNTLQLDDFWAVCYMPETRRARREKDKALSFEREFRGLGFEACLSHFQNRAPFSQSALLPSANLKDQKK